MPLKRLGIERPNFEGLDDTQRQYVTLLEAIAMSNTPTTVEAKSAIDPRTWPISTYVAVVGMVLTAFLWAFNSGGEWKTLNERVSTIQVQVDSNSATFARRDLIEAQMSYMVSSLNELKVKVDNLANKK